MRNLNRIVLGLTSMFAATVLAQALNTHLRDTTIVQAQAGGQTNGQGQIGGQDPMDSQGRTGSGDTDRMNEGRTYAPATTSPMNSDKDRAKSAYRTPGRNAKKEPARGDAFQAREGKKREFNSGE